MNDATQSESALHRWIANPSVAGVEIPAAEPVPPVVAPPTRPQPRGSAPSIWRSPLLWIVLAVAAIAIIAVAASRGRRASAASQNSGEPVRTAKVERRDFVRAVRVSGTVEAVQSHPVSAPRLTGQTASTLVITKLIPNGTKVHVGDFLVEFDRQQQIRNAQDKEAEYNDFVQQIKKLQADQATARAGDDNDLKQAEDAFSTAQLEVKRSEVLSRIQVEKNKETLDEAQAKLAQLKQTYQLKRTAEVAALKVLEIQRDRSRSAMIYANGNSEKMIIHSPLEGMAVLNSVIWRGDVPTEPQEGDEVRPGSAFMQVVDPTSMRVRAKVNQQDMTGLSAGNPVQVRLDAYPDLVFSGRLAQMPAIAVTSAMSQKVHTFTVLFSIDGVNPKLLPDLSAAVDVELERVPNALVVPRDALVSQDGKMYVRVQRAGGDDLRPVHTGAMNEVDAVVDSGVQAGEVVLRGVAPNGNPTPAPASSTAPVDKKE
jgi:multidrug efflux pump subunit AcrA (membrane-fusion protein)